MICFQISTFVGSSTGYNQKYVPKCQLWFAFKLVPLLGHQQVNLQRPDYGTVVICFQISTFVGSSTGILVLRSILIGLWFAFKLVPLLGHQQGILWKKKTCLVVICFQISTFVGSSTGFTSIIYLSLKLWFAFKLVPLLGHQQVYWFPMSWNRSCDLISN